MAENLIRIRDPRFVLLLVALGVSAIFALGLWWFIADDSDSIDAAPELAAFVAADDDGLAEGHSGPTDLEPESKIIERRGDRRDGSNETATGPADTGTTPGAAEPSAPANPASSNDGAVAGSAPGETTSGKPPVLAVGGSDGGTATVPSTKPADSKPSSTSDRPSPAKESPEVKTNEPKASTPEPTTTTSATVATTAPTADADMSNTDMSQAEKPAENNETSTTTPSTTPPTSTKPEPAAEPKPAKASGSGYFATLPPGSALPSGADCASRVRPVAENVPENQPFNQTRGRKVTGTYLSINTAIASNNYEARIDGNYVGSTDEIIQWAACKWGFDEDLVRAQVYTESSWFAGKLGDCGETTHERTGGAGGCSSVGLIQVRSAETGKTHHPGLYPWVMESSALNLDYALAVKRLCFEGQESWLSDVSSEYRAGDEWNCMGRWFSGSFADGGSKNYQANLRKNLNERPWEGQYVGCPNWRDSFYCSGIDRPRID